MDLSTLLRPEAVKVATGFTSKKRLFQEIGEMASSVYGVSPRSVVEALQERESLGPTGVGGGIALPHARIDGIDRVVGVFVRAEKPFEFDAVDRKPVDLIFALLAPGGAGVDHLKALATVSRTMRDGDLCAKLRSNTDPVAVHAILTETRRPEAA